MTEKKTNKKRCFPTAFYFGPIAILPFGGQEGKHEKSPETSGRSLGAEPPKMPTWDQKTRNICVLDLWNATLATLLHENAYIPCVLLPFMYLDMLVSQSCLSCSR